MASLGFLLVLIFVVSPLLVLGLATWGIVKGIQAARRHALGKSHDPRRMEEGPRAPDAERESSSNTDADVWEYDATPRSAHTSAQYQRPSEQYQPTSERVKGRGNRDFEYLDVERGTTAAHIVDVMQGYLEDYISGDYARSVIDALDAAEFRRRSLMPEIESKFEPNTISWDRFVGPAQAALDAVLRNCALLANRVQSFDSMDYARMEQFYRNGGFDGNGNTDPVRLQRWKLLYDTKREMDDLRSTNDGLLLELGKLSAELAKLSSSQTHEESTRIAEEVSKLVDETKYYR